eukprot:gene1268-11355_t
MSQMVPSELDNQSPVLLKKNYNVSTTAFLQHNIWYHWALEVVSKLYSTFVCKNEEPKNEFDFLILRLEKSHSWLDRKDFINLFTHILRKQCSEPFIFIITFYLLEKFFRGKQVGSKEFKRYFTSCFILTSKMFEDKFCHTYDYFESLELFNFELNLKQLSKDEFHIFSHFNYNLFVKYEDLEEFIKIHSVSVSTRVISIVVDVLKSVQ